MLHFGLGLENFIPFFLYLGAFLAFILSVFWRPEIGLYYIVPLLPLQRFRYRLHVYPMGQMLVDIVLLGVLIGLLVRSRGKVFVRHPLNLYLLFLGIFYYVSLFLGSLYLNVPLPVTIDDPRFSDWKNYMVMPILYVAAASAVKDAKQMKFLIILMCLSILAVNNSFYGTTKDRDYSRFSYDLRYAGVLGYAGHNGFAAFEAQMMVFLLGLYASIKEKLPKLALLGVALTCAYCLLFSFSRGGYLAALAALVFLGLVKERKLLVLLFLLVVSWTTILPVAVRERLTMTYTEEGQLESSAAIRVNLWEDALVLVKRNPLLGTGFYTYRYSGYGREGFLDTHNYYIKMLVETGGVGIVLYLWLLWMLVREGFSLFRKARDSFLKGLGLGFTALMVCAIFVNFFGDRWSFLQVNGFLWTLLAFVVRGQAITQEAEEKEAVEHAGVTTEQPMAQVAA